MFDLDKFSFSPYLFDIPDRADNIIYENDPSNQNKKIVK